MWVSYSGSLTGYLGSKTLAAGLRPLGARAMTLSPAQDRNRFAMKRDVARRLGISKISDLARHWPPATVAFRRPGPVGP